MKTILFTLLAVWFAAAPACAEPDSFIWINVSVKCIVDPATGATPTNMYDAALRDSFPVMNRLLAVNLRGFRVRLVDLQPDGSFKRIGSLGDTTGPGQWYSTDLKN